MDSCFARLHETTGVDEHDVGALTVGRHRPAARGQPSRQLLRVDLVAGTAESHQRDPTGRVGVPAEGDPAAWREGWRDGTYRGYIAAATYQDAAVRILRVTFTDPTTAWDPRWLLDRRPAQRVKHLG